MTVWEFHRHNACLAVKYLRRARRYRALGNNDRAEILEYLAAHYQRRLLNGNWKVYR